MNINSKHFFSFPNIVRFKEHLFVSILFRRMNNYNNYMNHAHQGPSWQGPGPSRPRNWNYRGGGRSRRHSVARIIDSGNNKVGEHARTFIVSLTTVFSSQHDCGYTFEPPFKELAASWENQQSA